MTSPISSPTRPRPTMRALMAHDRGAVDNVVLGNRLNLEAWQGANAALASSSAGAEIACEDLCGQIQLGMTALAAAPMLAGLAASLAPLWRGEATAEWASAILPRVVAWGESLQAGAGAASLVWSRWTNMRGNFTGAREKLLALTPLDLGAHIDAGKIRVEGPGLSFAGEDALEHVAATIASGRPDRLTLRGDNGAGKSMFLLSLKHTLGERGVLLPSRHALVISRMTGSTGERALGGLWDNFFESARRNRCSRGRAFRQPRPLDAPRGQRLGRPPGRTASHRRDRSQILDIDWLIVLVAGNNLPDDLLADLNSFSEVIGEVLPRLYALPILARRARGGRIAIAHAPYISNRQVNRALLYR